MNFYKKIILTFFSLVLLFQAAPTYAAGTDVYLVYVGGDKSLKNNITALLPQDLAVKHYNASMLLMADYSGKQKVVARLSKAKLVVFINGNEKPGELLEITEFPSSVIVENDSEGEVAKITAAL